MPLNIYKKRKELGLTLEAIAKQVGVSKSTVKKWESGYIKNMRRDKIENLAKALQVSPMDILLSVDSNFSALPQSVSLTKDILEKYNELVKCSFKQSSSEGAILILYDNSLTLVDQSSPVFQKILNFVNKE